MLLAIDLGNTNISFGIFKGNSIIKTFDVPLKQYSLRVGYPDSIHCSKNLHDLSHSPHIPGHPSIRSDKIVSPDHGIHPHVSEGCSNQC